MSQPIDFLEVTGPDTAALEAFYGPLFGWTASSRPFPGYIYSQAGDLRIGFRQEGAAVPVERLAYVGVSDVKATLDAAVAAGATVALPVMTVPGVGTFAVFSDPAGNRMGLWQVTAEG